MLHIVFALIVLHAPDGREIDVAMDEITSLQCKLPNVENLLFDNGVNAIVNMTDGKRAAVSETCSEVRDLIEAKQREINHE